MFCREFFFHGIQVMTSQQVVLLSNLSLKATTAEMVCIFHKKKILPYCCRRRRCCCCCCCCVAGVISQFMTAFYEALKARVVK